MVDVNSSKNIKNVKIDTSMIDEFQSPVFEQKNQYMYINNDGFIVYKDIDEVVDDINASGKIAGISKVVLRDWEAGHKYLKNETCVYNNGIYKCLALESSPNEFVFDEWRMIAGYSKTSEFYRSQEAISEIVLETAAATKGCILINVDNSVLLSNRYSLGLDGKTITFDPAIPANSEIEVIVYGNMIIPTNVDNIITKTFTPLEEEDTFYFDDYVYKKDLITVNINGRILRQDEFEINPTRDGIILDTPVAANTKVQAQYFNNLDLSIGATFTPHVDVRPKENPDDITIVDISWTNDQGLVNPISVTIKDGTTFIPSVEKNGLQTTIEWSNTGGLENPDTVYIYDGATFIPTVTKAGFTTTLSWSNDSGLVNPRTVYIYDGVNFIPRSVRNDNTVTISWTNDQGKVNPDSVVLYDGTTYEPHVSKVDYTTTLSWSNEAGKQNPETVEIYDGVIYTPHLAKSGIKTTLSWTNNQNKPNPQDVIISDGATFTPSWTKSGYTTTISWTNNDGRQNPPDLQLFDGVNFTPSATRSGNRTTISWTNDQGKPNPSPVEILDGANFIPHASPINYVDTEITWTNDQGLDNPPAAIIPGGVTFTPTSNVINAYTNKITWSNNGGLENPDDITIVNGVNYTPSTSKDDYTTTIIWNNDQGKPNPEPVEILDGIIFTPHCAKSGIKTTLSWSNNQGAENPQSVIISDGATFTPEAVKIGKVVTISWTNNDDLPNPQSVTITDGVNYIPHLSKNDYTTTLSWTNDMGMENPQDSYILDGVIWTPHTEQYDNVDIKLSWTNNQGMENPDDVIIKGGATYTPVITRINNYTDRLSWTNNDNLPNPQTIDIVDGVNWIPHVSKDETTSTTTLSWTNDQGYQNPDTVEIYDGKVNDVLINGSSVVTDRIARITLGTMATEDKNDYVTLAAYNTKVAELEQADSDLEDAIEAEETRATGVENQLRTDLTAETTRATGVENQLRTDLTAETTRATTAESNLNTAIETAESTLRGLITDEETRAINAEEDLEDLIEAEETRAEGVEQTLQTNITAETTRATGVENQLRTDLTAETTRATTAEGNLQSQINDLDDGTEQLTQDLADEIARATGAESDLEDAIEAETTRATGVENQLRADLTAETTRATTAEENLQTNITAETTRATGVENQLRTDLTAETTRATTAESGLRTDLTAETTRATTAEQALDAAKVDKVSTANRVYGTDSNGDQTTYDYDSFGKVDDVKVGTTSVVTNKIANLGTMAGETTDDYYKKTDLADIATSGSWADLDNTPTTIAGYGITDAYTKSEIDGKLSASMHFKGTVPTVADLPSSGQQVGDMYNVLDTGSNYAWDGTHWDKLSETIDLSPYDNHIANHNNPHQVTKAQVGLGNVDNTSDANKPVSTAQQAAIDAVADDLDDHIADNTNPHQVTKAQVGLGNVDNTSDANKPVSTAQQTALNTKVDKVSTASRVYGTDASGAQTTYDFNALGKVDDVKVGTTSVVTNKIANLGTMAGETAANYSTKAVADTLYSAKSLETTVNNLDLALSQEIQRATDRETALNTKIETETTRATGVEAGLQSSKADKATTYTKTEIDGMLSGAMHFKGSVPTVADLPSSGQQVGDMYNVTASGANYAWDGTQWVKMSETVDLSDYALTSYVNTQDQAETTARIAADNTKVDKVSTPSRVYGTDELGQQITYGTALFGNIDDVTVGGTSVVVNRVAPLGTMASETATDYAKDNTVVKLTGNQTIAGTKTFNNDVLGYSFKAQDSNSYGMFSRGYIELSPSNTTNIGGYIDFHYNGNTSDYTSRIIEDASGQININGAKFINNGYSLLARQPNDTTTSSLQIDTVGARNTAISTVNDKIIDYYGTCDTAAATQTKDVVCTGFSLKTGASVRVKFTNGQNYNGAIKLNVNNTGAIDAKYVGTSGAARYTYCAGELVSFTYDGTNWLIEDGGLASTTYYGVTKLATTATSTNQGTALTPASLDSYSQNTVTGYPAYSASSTYAVGNRVRYGWQTFECNTAITTAEAWTAAHWTALDPLQTQVDAKLAMTSVASKIYGTNAQGNQTTYNVSDLTNTVTDVKVGSNSVVTNKIANLGTMAGETAADYSKKTVADTLYAAKSLETTVSTLSTTVSNKVDKVTNANKVYGTNGSGAQTTYNVSDLTNTVTDVKVGNTSVVSNKIATLGTMASETASNYSTKAVADTLYAPKSTTYTKTEVDNLIANTTTIVIRDWNAS